MGYRILTASLLGALLSLPCFAQEPTSAAPPPPGPDSLDPGVGQLQPTVPLLVDAPVTLAAAASALPPQLAGR